MLVTQERAVRTGRAFWCSHGDEGVDLRYEDGSVGAGEQNTGS